MLGRVLNKECTAYGPSVKKRRTCLIEAECDPSTHDEAHAARTHAEDPAATLAERRAEEPGAAAAGAAQVAQAELRLPSPSASKASASTALGASSDCPRARKATQARSDRMNKSSERT